MTGVRYGERSGPGILAHVASAMSRAIGLTLALAIGSTAAPTHGALIAQWDARDFRTGTNGNSILSDGNTVASWVSTGASTVLNGGTSPVYELSFTPAGTDAVVFLPADNDRLFSSGTSPIGGLSAFSVVYVLRAFTAGSTVPCFPPDQWYCFTGLVDAEEPGFANDWGTTLDTTGGVRFGVGNPDTTIVSGSIVDGRWHVITATWNGGAAGTNQFLYVDGIQVASSGLNHGGARNNATFGFGRQPTGVAGTSNAAFAEIRFYNHALTAAEVTSLSASLQTTHAPPCGNGSVDSGEQCDPPGTCCTATCQFAASSTLCRASAGACDLAENCTGSAAACPADAKSTAVCRAAGGVCDVAESCDGVNNTCPTDGFASGGVCRPVADVCDAPESCDGSGPNCPADAFLNSGVCRASAGVCDVAESCDGSGAACPPDAFQPATVECRAASPGEACDVAENCTGSAAECPVDGFKTMGTPCRAAVNDCDVAEACAGSSSSCPTDAKQPDNTACNDNDTCTMTDTCQSGTCTGADPINCDDGDACTADSCDPMGGCINDDAPATGCLTAGKSLVLIKNATDDSKDKLLWKWIKGAAFTQMDLADPTAPAMSANYALCVYAGTANALIADAGLPPGGGWSAVGSKGYKFKGTSPDGLSLALLKGGAAGKSKALAKGRGAGLPDPTLPLAYPVTVQLKKDGSPLCLESTFTMANEKKNTATQFKAKK